MINEAAYLIGAIPDEIVSVKRQYEIGYLTAGTKHVQTEAVHEISEKRARERFKNKHPMNRIIYAILVN